MKFKRACSLFGVLAVATLSASAGQEGLSPAPYAVSFKDAVSTGLLDWSPAKTPGEGESISVPQVKVFGVDGVLRFQGTAREAIQWAKGGMPAHAISSKIRVRDVAAESKVTKSPLPATKRELVTFYVSEPCPPCGELLQEFRADFDSRAKAHAEIRLVRVGDRMQM